MFLYINHVEPMTPGSQAERPMRSRPTRVTIAAIVLIAVAGLAFLYGSVGFLSYFGSFQEYGSATGTTAVEFVTGALAQALIPVAIALVAGTAAIGLLRGTRWGAALTIAASIVFLVGGLALLYGAMREWGLPGSFAVLYLPPAVVAILVGAYVGLATLTSGSYFADR
jgi:hypothetical protein